MDKTTPINIEPRMLSKDAAIAIGEMKGGPNRSRRKRGEGWCRTQYSAFYTSGVCCPRQGRHIKQEAHDVHIFERIVTVNQSHRGPSLMIETSVTANLNERSVNPRVVLLSAEALTHIHFDVLDHSARKMMRMIDIRCISRRT